MSLSWLPNAISLIRIALVPPILALLLNGHHDISPAWSPVSDEFSPHG